MLVFAFGETVSKMRDTNLLSSFGLKPLQSLTNKEFECLNGPLSTIQSQHNISSFIEKKTETHRTSEW